jgi:hypothetical protein
MSGPVEYTRGEKVALIALGVVGFVLNAVFLYSVFTNWQQVVDAHLNPVSAVFIAEAVLLMWFFAYLLRKWGVARLGWGWFVVLSLLGSMAFAIPVVLLWPRGKKQAHPGEPAA